MTTEEKENYLIEAIEKTLFEYLESQLATLEQVKKLKDKTLIQRNAEAMTTTRKETAKTIFEYTKHFLENFQNY